jgi:hypothetical protein
MHSRQEWPLLAFEIQPLKNYLFASFVKSIPLSEVVRPPRLPKAGHSFQGGGASGRPQMCTRQPMVDTKGTVLRKVSGTDAVR